MGWWLPGPGTIERCVRLGDVFVRRRLHRLLPHWPHLLAFICLRIYDFNARAKLHETVAIAKLETLYRAAIDGQEENEDARPPSQTCPSRRVSHEQLLERLHRERRLSSLGTDGVDDKPVCITRVLDREPQVLRGKAPSRPTAPAGKAHLPRVCGRKCPFLSSRSLHRDIMSSQSGVSSNSLSARFQRMLLEAYNRFVLIEHYRRSMKTGGAPTHNSIV